MEAILPYLIQTLGGAGGGFLGNMLKKNALGLVGNLVAGGVGGNILPIAMSALGLMGGGAGAADGGGSSMITSILGSVLGGGLGSVVGGLLKK
jgi:hypothetical protein